MKEWQIASDLSLLRWTLGELLAMVTFAAIAASFASSGHTLFGVFFFLTMFSVRVAMVDFTIAGSVASGLVLCFGIPTMFLALWWASCV